MSSEEFGWGKKKRKSSDEFRKCEVRKVREMSQIYKKLDNDLWLSDHGLFLLGTSI